MALRSTARRGLALAALAGLLAPGAGAEVRQLEAVGAAPIRSGASRQSPREEAVRIAIREAVQRVAEELLLDQEQGEDSQPSLEEVLGQRMVPYTSSYRILEDRGRRQALFADDPDVTTEYVVIVEVEVDADRVEERLVAAGLMQPRSASQLIGRVRVEVEGVDAYAAYDAVRRLLASSRGARVIPIEFTPGHAVLQVETGLSPSDLLDQVLSEAPPELEVVPLRTGGASLALAVEWTPPPAATR